MSRVVYVVRHGNRQDFTEPGWTETAARPDDPDLSTDGLVQARELAERLAPEPLDHLFSSPYLRTMRTADFCARRIQLNIFMEDGIGEWLDPAKFTARPTLLSRRELLTEFPAVAADYEPVFRPDFPESAEALLIRCRLVIHQLLDKFPGNLLLVGHGASCKGLVFSLLGRIVPFEPAMCSLTKLVGKSDSFELELKGDTSFLSSGPLHSGKFHR